MPVTVGVWARVAARDGPWAIIPRWGANRTNHSGCCFWSRFTAGPIGRLPTAWWRTPAAGSSCTRCRPGSGQAQLAGGAVPRTACRPAVGSGLAACVSLGALPPQADLRGGLTAACCSGVLSGGARITRTFAAVDGGRRGRPLEARMRGGWVPRGSMVPRSAPAPTGPPLRGRLSG